MLFTICYSIYYFLLFYYFTFIIFLFFVTMYTIFSQTKKVYTLSTPVN